MLKKKYRLSKKDFETALRKKGTYLKVDFLKFKVIYNNLETSRFGVSCGVKISKKAVMRNQIKRRINESLRLNFSSIRLGFDVLVMPDPIVIEKTYQDIDKAILEFIKILNTGSSS
ncbi:MAG: ribonuclease P protein component [Candidatus Paceibacterota bacterium]|jgi:ribonuclease P protein component